MFLGLFQHALDAKHRLTLPARWRTAFAEGGVVSADLDGCLALYTQAEWQQFVTRWLERLDPLSGQARQMRRFLFAQALEVEPDRSGRLQLPRHLAEHAGLKRQVVLAGVRDHIEIWASSSWQKTLDEAVRDARGIAEKLARDGGNDGG